MSGNGGVIEFHVLAVDGESRNILGYSTFSLFEMLSHPFRISLKVRFAVEYPDRLDEGFERLEFGRDFIVVFRH